MAAIDNRKLLGQLLEAGKPHGVTCAGVCRLEDISRIIECRGASRLPPSGSVIVMLLPYYTGEHPFRNVAAYAVPDDYHRVAGSIMEDILVVLRHEYPAAEFTPFVDSSPIPEVEAAQLAGLGYRGRNNQLITPGYGSMVFICEIVTNLMLIPSEPSVGRCGECWRCVDACPTGALWGGEFDRSRCRSELTQKKGELGEWEAHQIAIGGLVWGCDICTKACPHNSRLPVTPVPQFTVNLLPRLSLERLDTEITNKSYVWRGKAILRRNLGIIAQLSERK